MKAMFSSNFMELLVEKLKKNLFFSSSKSESYIFVPNIFVKNYLMQKFSDDPHLKICFGLNFVNISNFLNFFLDKLNSSKDETFLDFLELNFLVRQKIISHMDNPTDIYKSLYKYLVKDEKILEKRLISLSFELTQIYLKYSIYENIESLIESSKNQWQIALFYEIFYKDRYKFCIRDLKHLDIQKIQDFNFHFFAISYMPGVYFDFIHQFKNAYHYFISPTNYFFEDTLSNFERQKLKSYLTKKNASTKQIDELDSYLKDSNSFLANTEKLKRNYLKIVSSYDDIETFEDYQTYKIDNFNKENPITLLKNFQNDILNLKNRENNLKNVEVDDDSFQLHIATSKFREIQILHLNILKLLDQNKDLKLSDIHVIAENIDEYVPYIQMVFSDEKKSLNYKISDLHLSSESHFISGLQKLISLTNSRFEKEDILDLFENPLFQKTHKFSFDEIEILFNWIEKANISWGLDKEHILKFLKKEDSAFLKSFEKGIARILLSAIFALNRNVLDGSFKFDYPILELEISDLAILEKFLKTLISLYNDLQVIEERKNLTIFEWQKYLRKLAQNHFGIFQKFGVDKEEIFIEKRALSSFKNFLQDLKNIAFRFGNQTFSFEVIFDHLEKHLSRCKTEIHQNALNAIHFSSFEISYLPTKAMFIIGLDIESFQIKTKSSLDISNAKDVPTLADHKRSLFLQSLLNAKESLILSYSSREDEKLDKAMFLQELLSYLDNSYRILDQKPSEYIVKKHPIFAFHKSYFSKREQAFSKENFMAAISYYDQRAKSTKRSLNVKPFDILNRDSKIIDLRLLKQLCKNPISFYLNKMDIFLKEAIEKNDFKISNLDKYIIKQASLKNEIKDVLDSFEKQAKMPFGFFNDIAKDKIKSDALTFLKDLKDLNVDIKNLRSIEFNLDCKNVTYLGSKTIIMPPMEVKGENGPIKIIGKIENFSNQGLLTHLDDKIYNQIRLWPEILALNKLDENFEKKVVFAKSKSVRAFEINNVDEYFVKLIDYFDRAQNEISFMIKPFCEHILNSDEKLLNKALQKIGKNNTPLDIYSKWFFKNFEKPKAKTIIENSSDILKKVFKELLEKN